MKIIVVGIHTGIGKTICSSILCEILQADYWKPVQAGDLENSDSIFVSAHTNTTRIHPERFRLTVPASPHCAAQVDGVEIKLDDFTIPKTNNTLIIETAGGLMSPLSMQVVNIDLLLHFNLPVVLVSENYLGSINHTLLSIQLLKEKKINVVGIVFNGNKNKATEDFINNYSGLPTLFCIPKFSHLNRNTIVEFANENRSSVIQSLQR